MRTLLKGRGRLCLIQQASFWCFTDLSMLSADSCSTVATMRGEEMQFHEFVSRGHIQAEIKFEWCRDTPWLLSRWLPLCCLLACSTCWCKRWQALLTDAECARIWVWSAQLISCESRVRFEGLCYQFSSLGCLNLPVNPLILYLCTF